MRIALALVVAVSGVAGIRAQEAQADVAPTERRVLVELFAATGGERWTAREGWNTSAPVCDWYGVQCDFVDGDARRPFVAALRLRANSLEGTIPASLAALSRLQSMDVSGNRLTGAVPEALLERWDAHRFEFEGEGNAFSNLVVRVTITHAAGGVLCAEGEDVHYRIDFDAVTGRAVFQSVRCETGSRRTYCLRREGRPPSLARVSRALTAVGFTSLKPSYDFPFTGATHGSTVTTTAAWGDGTRRTLRTFDRQGPRAAWLAQQILLGLEAEASWEPGRRTPTCAFE
jgi:hypothetical protein